METGRQIFLEFFDADAPLSRAGLAAAIVCVLWAALAIVWAAWRVCRRRRSAGAVVSDNAPNLPEAPAGTDLQVLRHAVHTLPRAKHLVAGIRDIEPNQPVTVRLGNGKGFDSFVVRAVGGDVCLAVPLAVRLDGQGLSEKSVKVSFSRPRDARYEFASRIVDAGEEGVVLRPTEPLHRIQQRRDVRVRCRDVVRFGGQRESAGEPNWRGRLGDISIGGASFVGDKELKTGEPILMQLDLGKTMGTLLLAARVIRQKPLRGTSEERLQTSVRFAALSPRQERRLGAFLADLQQRRIRRMRLRADLPEEKAGAVSSPAAQPGGKRGAFDLVAQAAAT